MQPRAALAGQLLLLGCGIASSLLYVAANVLGAVKWPSYSSASQTVSELSAIDAPSRPLVVPLFFAYGALVVPFGVGVWRSARGRRVLHAVGALLIGYGLLCLTGPLTPMHQRLALARGEATLTDTLHLVGAAADVGFILLILGFGAKAFGTGFRLYSIATMLALLVCGLFVSLDAPRVAHNLPTPWAGVTERITIFGFMLWVAVLALVLLRCERSAARSESEWVPHPAL